jgi:hypothetical protein
MTTPTESPARDCKHFESTAKGPFCHKKKLLILGAWRFCGDVKCFGCPEYKKVKR